MSNDSKIIPTVGRVVWYHPAPGLGSANFAEHYQPGSAYAAIVSYVNSDRLVNLAVFDANGTPHSRASVPLIQEGETLANSDSDYCEWMPFQKGQAKAQSAAPLIGLPVRDLSGGVTAEQGTGIQLDFGDALSHLKLGRRVARTGWNGRGMFVYHVPAASYPAQTGAAKAHFGADAMVPYNAYFALKGVDGAISTWVPSVSDCLAEDWVVVW